MNYFKFTNVRLIKCKNINCEQQKYNYEMSHQMKMSEDEGFSQMIGWTWLLLDYNDINMATFSSKHSLVTDRQTDGETDT